MVLSELLAPAGSYDVFKVAINAGAGAVYIAGKKFGARAYAENFTLDEIEKSIEYAHKNNARVYITINTLINNFEIVEVLGYIFNLYKFGVDAVIIQDLGIIPLIKSIFPDLAIHASTQMTLNNYESIIWAYNQGISRIILPREVNIDEIKKIHSKLEKNNIDIELEVFGHGALCYSISGNCFMSSLNSGRSGNRGACAQPCRREYKLKYKGYNIGNGYLLSTHDLNTSDNLEELSKAGITSLKLEGRMKSEDYIGTIVNTYRNILDNKDDKFKNDLNLVFNRKFTKGYLLNDKPGNVMGRESSGHEGLYIGDIIGVNGDEVTVSKNKDIKLKTGDGIAFKHNKKIKGIYLDNIVKQTKENIIFNTTRFVSVGDKVFISYSNLMHKQLRQFRKDNIKSKIPLSLDISFNENLEMVIYYEFKFKDIKLYSKYISHKFEKAINRPISSKEIKKQLSKTGGTSFFIDKIEINDLPLDIFTSLKNLNNIKRELLNKATKILLNYQKPNKKELNLSKSKLDNFINKYKKEKFDNNLKTDISVFVDNLELIKIASNYNIKKIYFDPSFLYNNPTDYFKNIKELLTKASSMVGENELVWVLPSFISSDEINKCSVIFKDLENNGIPLSIMTDNLGLENDFNCYIYGNHDLNIWNSFAVKNLKKNGFDSLILSSELSNKEIREIILKSPKNIDLELIVHGNLEVICSRDDFSNLNDGKDFIIKNNSDYAILEDKKRKKFRYKVLFDFNNKSHILNKDCICLIEELKEIKDLGINSIVLDCRFTNESFTSNIISTYSQGLKNSDTNSLKSLREEISLFSQSYINKGNFIDGRIHEK